MLNKMLAAGMKARVTTQMYPMLPLSQFNMRLFHGQTKSKLAMNTMFNQNKRHFTEGAVATQEEPKEESLADVNARIGVDTTFSNQKHAYVLTFPWNFDEIIDEF